MTLTVNTRLLREGLQNQVEVLEELRHEFLGDVEAPLACADCYNIQDECYCENPILWPLPNVLYKLKAELSRQIQE